MEITVKRLKDLGFTARSENGENFMIKYAMPEWYPYAIVKTGYECVDFMFMRFYDENLKLNEQKASVFEVETIEEVVDLLNILMEGDTNSCKLQKEIDAEVDRASAINSEIVLVNQ